MAKFGRRNDGRLYLDTPGDPPEPPEKVIVARFLAVASTDQLARLLDDLYADAGQRLAMFPHQENALQPRSYPWFITVALSAIHKIRWTQTAQATADWHVHQRSKRTPTHAELQANIARVAGNKSMGDRR
jgi:hypothetical protein